MTRDQLREVFKKYNLTPSIVEQKETLQLFADLFLRIIKTHHADSKTVEEAQTKLVLQMMLTKALHLRQILNGAGFQASDGTVLNEIIDPTIVASLTRNIYEMIGMFHIVFVNPKTDDERTVIYLLWVIAGLSYRQRFETNASTPENKEKFEKERRAIQEMTVQIQNTELFKQLNERNQSKILNRIQAKECLIRFDNNEVYFLVWRDLPEVMGIKPELFDNMYTYFSLYAHPSNVSVFQFGDMFSKEERAFVDLAGFNTTYAIQLLSIFLADYIKIFPAIKNLYEELPVIQQIILDYPNKFARGEEYSINKAYEALG